jgi:peptidoglycan hydrolase CwlO-like protein
MNICFSTRSVRIFVKNAPPEGLPFKRIVAHTTRKGDTADEGTIIEELHDKIMKQDGQIERLKNEKAQLQEKISKNYLGDLLRAVNLMQQGLQEKKHKMEQIDSGLRQIQATLAAINNE